MSSDIPIRLRTGLDLHELTSDKGTELYFDDSQDFKGMFFVNSWLYEYNMYTLAKEATQSQGAIC